MAQQRGFNVGLEQSRSIVIDDESVERRRKLHARETIGRVHIGNRREIIVC